MTPDSKDLLDKWKREAAYMLASCKTSEECPDSHERILKLIRCLKELEGALEKISSSSDLLQTASTNLEKIPSSSDLLQTASTNTEEEELFIELIETAKNKALRVALKANEYYAQPRKRDHGLVVAEEARAEIEKIILG